MQILFSWCRFVLLLALLFISRAFAADNAGSADYRDVGRFKGSEIVSYKADNYGATTIATGAVRKQPDIGTTEQKIEGQIVRILYRVPGGSSALEVFRNFESRINAAGYQTIFSGGPQEINKYLFTYKHPVEILDETSLGNELWYLSAKGVNQGVETYLSLLVSPHSGGDGLRVRLIGVQAKAMENRMLDADAMQAAIADTGKVALYGIYFDTGSAKPKAESNPTLEQIAALLKASAELVIVVVGHTDNRGGLDYNRDLSRRRARSVAEALTDRYGIASARIRHDGIGYLAPAASNDSASGRALNRRVELVKEK
jgi:outer membrane protein OmpA-like peptidoglycan-associated protein